MSHARKVRRSHKYEIDVVMPVYGQHELVLRAVASILAQEQDCMIHIVDDGTPADLKHEEALHDVGRFPRVRVHKRARNEGFVAASNFGASIGSAPYIVHMNSDVELLPDALANLVQTFSLSPDVGVAGAKLLFPEDSTDKNRPAGKVQHAGMAFGFDLRPFHVHMGWSANNHKTCISKEMQAVTGALFATKRSLWKALKGFDPVYGRGTFEDVDYCIRARMESQGVIYCAEAIAYHFAGATVSRVPPPLHFPLQQNAFIFATRAQNVLMWDDWRFW